VKILEKKVYYCDYCKKHRMTKNSMEIHEGKCLYNPKRICRAAYCSGGVGVSIKEMQDVIDDCSSDLSGDAYYPDEKMIDKLLEEHDGCPICLVALFCQTARYAKSKNITFFWQFDFVKIHRKLYTEWQEDQPFAY